MRSYHMKALVVSLTMILAEAPAAILRIPYDKPKIQMAIDASVNGDTVLVAPGTYFENINFHGKNIVVASNYLLTNDPSFIASTIINGGTPVNADTASCVLMISGESAAAVLEGFTLTGGKGTRWKDEHGAGTYREGGGILTALSAPTIRNNYITGNEAIDRTGVTSAGGGGIRSGDGNPTILNNVIVGNRGRYGAGIVLNYTGAQIRNNIVAQNFGGEDFGGAGIWVNSNGTSAKIIENNTIADNSAPTNDGGGLLVQSTSVTTRNNIIWGNSAHTGSQISVATGSSAHVSYCDVQGGFAGIGNINVNPIFIDTSYYLSTGSPCIDAGNPESTYNDPADTLNPAIALFPARGTLGNDLGAFGGPGSLRTLYVDLHLNDPHPPSAFTAYSDYQTPHSITLQWTDPTTRNDGTPLSNFVFHLYRGPAFIAEIDSGVQQFVDSGLVLHNQYHYFIRTVIPNDSSIVDSSQAYAGGHRQPQAPVLTSIVDASDGIRINWTNPSRQLDNTPLNDLAYVLLYRDNALLVSIAQSASDTAQQRTYLDTTTGYHSYRLQVEDSEVPVNFSASTDSSLAYGKIVDQDAEDFEQGTGRVYITGAWDTTSSIAFSGSHCITDSRIGNSTPGSETSILLPPLILGDYPALRFSDIAIVQPGSYAIIDLSLNHRRTFRTLKYYDWTAHAQWQDGHADPGDWVNEIIDLSAYARDTATIRFRLIAGTSAAADGWYIDDIYAGPADTAGARSNAYSASWNMISLPLLIANGQRLVAFPSSISQAFSYNGHYVPQDSMAPGGGYWLKFASAESVTMTGRVIPKDTLKLTKGWNLIGSVSGPVAPLGISTLPSSILRSAFYTFDSLYEPQAVLQPGKAYWIKSSAGGRLILNSLVSTAIPFAKQEDVLAGRRRNSIEFIDAGGHRKQLLLMNGADESAVNEELPPLPPEGMFDIRFATNRDHEIITNGVRDLPIHLQSVVYPLIVRWNFSDDTFTSTLLISNKTTLMEGKGSLTIGKPENDFGIALRITSSSHVEKPVEFALHQNYPNPFNPATKIGYDLPENSHVRLKILDVLGREIATLVDEDQDAGVRSVAWDAGGVSSGVYFSRLEASSGGDGRGSFVGVRKMILMK